MSRGRQCTRVRDGQACAGILLTGGASRRLGRDKASLIVEGETLARRTGRLLVAVCELAVEVGPGRSGLPSVLESPRGGGPLAGLLAGERWLALQGYRGPVLLVATDLPRLHVELLAQLRDVATSGSVLPVVDGRSQPLLARWSPEDLDEAHRQWARGERSLRFLGERPEVLHWDRAHWAPAIRPQDFADVDTPEDARDLGLRGALGEERSWH